MRRVTMPDGDNNFHGDEGHSCYSEDGQLTCVVAKMLLSDGPGWRELSDEQCRDRA